jgi:hypothetical protein
MTILGLRVNRICTWLPRKGENIDMRVGVIRFDRTTVAESKEKNVVY